MSVTTLDSRTSFILILGVPAEVGPSGEIIVRPVNLVPVGTGAVQTVFGRAGAIVPVAGDYAATEVTNDSHVAGATVAAALDTLEAAAAAQLVWATGYMHDLTAAGDDDSIFVPAPIAGTLTAARISGTFVPDVQVNLKVEIAGVEVEIDNDLFWADNNNPGDVVVRTVQALNAVTINQSVEIRHDTPANTVAGHLTILLGFLPA